MADKRPGQKIKMTSIDELLCVPDASGTTEICVRDIYPFENHPFKVLDDEKMEELIESIKENGILTPVIVRKDRDDLYQMISGHRRLYAAKKAGLEDILKARKAAAKPAAAAEEEVKAPPAEIVTAQIAGIEVMDLEDGVQALWKNGIYAESGMGCTGPIIRVSDANLEKAKEILTAEGYIG